MAARSEHTPNLSHFSFWDVDQNTIDYDRHAGFVIIRVMEKGNEQDMKEMIRYYGKDEVISQLTSATSLMSTAIEAGKHLFHLKDSDFSCFTDTPQKRNLSLF